MQVSHYDIKFGLLFGACLLAAGLLLQFLCGPIGWGGLAFPANLILLVGWLALCFLMYRFLGKRPFARWLSDMSCATASLVWCAALTVLMGLLRQRGSGDVPAGPSGSPASWPGFHWMTSQWSFFLMYLWLCTSVLMALFRLSLPLAFTAKKIAFLSSHAGILTMLAAGTLGSADFSQVRLQVERGQTVWTDGVGIELLDFESETYEDGSAKAFRSFVSVHLPDGTTEEAVIEVNKPCSADGLKIYQVGYDTENGAYSVLEAVRDPWFPAVFVGILLTLLGAFLRFFRMDT